MALKESKGNSDFKVSLELLTRKEGRLARTLSMSPLRAAPGVCTGLVEHWQLPHLPQRVRGETLRGVV